MDGLSHAAAAPPPLSSPFASPPRESDYCWSFYRWFIRFLTDSQHPAASSTCLPQTMAINSSNNSSSTSIITILIRGSIHIIRRLLCPLLSEGLFLNSINQRVPPI